jgi:hypothetical protein
MKRKIPRFPSGLIDPWKPRRLRLSSSLLEVHAEVSEVDDSTGKQGIDNSKDHVKG